MPKNTKSAKDIAFEKERARMRHNYEEKLASLQKELDITKQENENLQNHLKKLESALQEKEEWISRLLEYMDLPKEDVKVIIQKEKQHAELYQKMDSLFDKTNSFLGLYM